MRHFLSLKVVLILANGAGPDDMLHFIWIFTFCRSTRLGGFHFTKGERSGSVVECLTRDRGALGSSLTGVTSLWSLSKTHLSLLCTGPTQEDPSLFN